MSLALLLPALLMACARGEGDTALLDVAADAPPPEAVGLEAAPVAEVDLDGLWIDLSGRRYLIRQAGDHVFVHLHRVSMGEGQFFGPRAVRVGFDSGCCTGFLDEHDDDTIHWSNRTSWTRD